MQPEMQTNDVHSHQWLDIRLLWDHHSCQYLIFTVGWAKNIFVSFLNIWVLTLAKLVQCIISLSFKKTGNFSIITPYWHQFCSAAPEPTLFWSTSVTTQTLSWLHFRSIAPVPFTNKAYGSYRVVYLCMCKASPALLKRSTSVCWQ